jgi:hypothetical protein
MLLTGTTARRLRLIRSGVGLLLYLLTITFTPLAHAQNEREFGAASFEAAHSAQCLPLHDEALCSSCSAHGAIRVTPVTTCGIDGLRSTALPPSDYTSPPAAPANDAPAARAPPR